MAISNTHRTFATSAALALLDKIIELPAGRAMPAARIAWESAWIACLTNCPGWAATAERDFQKALIELATVLQPTRAVPAGRTRKARSSMTGEASYSSAFRLNPASAEWKQTVGH